MTVEFAEAKIPHSSETFNVPKSSELLQDGKERQTSCEFRSQTRTTQNL